MQGCPRVYSEGLFVIDANNPLAQLNKNRYAKCYCLQVIRTAKNTFSVLPFWK